MLSLREFGGKSKENIILNLKPTLLTHGPFIIGEKKALAILAGLSQ